MLTLILAAAIGADVPKHLAETVLEAELEDARQAYDKAVEAAHTRAREALERASKAATTKGELDKALAYRDRARRIGAPDRLIGTYDFRWANNTNFHRTFDSSGMLTSGGKDGIALWSGGRGLLYDETTMEAIRIEGDKVFLLHFPGHSVIRGEAVKIK